MFKDIFPQVHQNYILKKKVENIKETLTVRQLPLVFATERSRNI